MFITSALYCSLTLSSVPRLGSLYTKNRFLGDQVIHYKVLNEKQEPRRWRYDLWYCRILVYCSSVLAFYFVTCVRSYTLIQWCKQRQVAQAWSAPFPMQECGYGDSPICKSHAVYTFIGIVQLQYFLNVCNANCWLGKYLHMLPPTVS